VAGGAVLSKVEEAVLIVSPGAQCLPILIRVMHFFAPFLVLFLSAISQATSSSGSSSIKYSNTWQRELTRETMGRLAESAPAGVAAEAWEEFARYQRYSDVPEDVHHYLGNINGILTQHLPPEKQSEVMKHIVHHLTAVDSSTAASHIVEAKTLISDVVPLEVA
jgi:hypothetical protein